MSNIFNLNKFIIITCIAKYENAHILCNIFSHIYIYTLQASYLSLNHNEPQIYISLIEFLKRWVWNIYWLHKIVKKVVFIFLPIVASIWLGFSTFML